MSTEKKGSARSKSKGPPPLELPAFLTVKQLSELLQVSGVEVIKQLMREGIMASINQVLDYDTAAMIAADFGHQSLKKPPPAPSAVEARKQPPPSQKGEEDLQQPRPSVITVMGHVDHGKTTLLDAIRQTKVAASEVGSITQHIGAYQVEVDDRRVTFIDTPGHEAFTAMRARGAQITDIVVIVVAADDGVMPQTIEAIAHAQAAGVPIVVALNKIDKPDTNLERIKRQLADQGLVIEEWGGDTICVPVSAKTEEGISELLEGILIVAEMLELKANPNQLASGTIIEAGLDKTKGPLATVLVQNGTLSLGDTVIVGNTWGKVKAMYNDRGERVKRVGPATPVKILGLNDVPQVGNTLTTIEGEGEARSLVQKLREGKQRGTTNTIKTLNLDKLSTQVREGEVKELNIVLKADVQGSIEPIRNSLEQLGTEEVRVGVIHSGSGSITEGDVLLALASKGIVIGFNTRPTLGAQRLAELQRVDIRCYEVIYKLMEEVEKALRGMLTPTYTDVIEGRVEIRAVFPSEKQKKVAGVYVTEGKVSRSALARILRQGKIIHESTVSSLRRFKDEVKEVSAGFECGVGVEGFTEFQAGDVIELYRRERTGESAH